MRAEGNEPRRLWCISGLGADSRMFGRLHLPGFECRTVEWIEPFAAESLEGYALRLRQYISDETPRILGLSFGGMLAVEMAKHTPVHSVIVLSSAKTYREIPWYWRALGKLSLQKLLPATGLSGYYPFTPWYFGMNSPEEKEFLRDVLRNNDPHFVQWALNALLHWKNDVVPPTVRHIHGSADHILPLRYIRGGREEPQSISGGGHFMLWTMAEEVSSLLSPLLSA